jgi:hypothetical protein
VHERGERAFAGAAKVPGCTRLPVGHDRQQPPVAESFHAIPERVAHPWPAIPLPDLGGYGQPYVIAEHGDQRLWVALFVRGDETLQQTALRGVGFGRTCVTASWGRGDVPPAGHAGMPGFDAELAECLTWAGKI